MRRKLSSLGLLFAGLVLVADGVSAQTVTPVPPDAPNHIAMAGVRYRGFAPPANGQEIFLGVEPLGNGAPYRVEGGVQYGTHNDFCFEYDAPNDQLITSVGPVTRYYTNFSTMLAALRPGDSVSLTQALRITLTLREAGPTLKLTNVRLNDSIPVGTGTFTAVYNTPLAWLITGFDFTQSFTIKGKIVLGGTYTNNQELNKVDISMIRLGVCGDGVVEGGEQCDDGNTVDGDCCSATCTSESAGSPCSDGNVCTVGDVCDGAGVCLSGPALGCVCGNGVVEGPEQCDDGNALDGDCCSAACTLESAGSPCSDGDGCTVGDTCSGTGICLAGSPLSCDDGVPCTVDSCVSPAGTCAHTPTPLTGCRSPGRSTLFMSNRAPSSRNKLSWAWIRGAATTHAEFSDPRTSADYFLCIFANGTLATAGPLAVSSSTAKWKGYPGDRGYRYRDGIGSESGVLGLVLRAGEEGRARARVRARGASLPVPLLPLQPPVRAQLVNGATGMCWESVFDQFVYRNSANVFRAVQK